MPFRGLLARAVVTQIVFVYSVDDIRNAAFGGDLLPGQ